jgi:hypothetical protein
MRIEIQGDSPLDNVSVCDPFRRSRMLKVVLRECAHLYGSSPTEMLSSRRTRNVARARWEFCYRAFTELDTPVSVIALLLGRTDETVRTAIAMHCQRNEIVYPPGFGGDFWLRRRAIVVERMKQKSRAAVSSKNQTTASA